MAEKLPIGVLLVNLGSPDSTKVSDVRRYLRQFLMDERVIDLPALGRWLLVHTMILPFRPRRSAQAYQKIWTDEGSPLLVESYNLQHKLSQKLGQQFRVKLAMRYGQPSIEQAVEQLIAEGCERLIVLPLYPQYASATTGSIYQELMRVLSRQWLMPAIDLIGDYFDDSRFISAFAAVARPQLSDFQPDYVLFSYHGLPVSHLLKTESAAKVCAQPDFRCCEQVNRSNRFCYRAQCLATSRALVEALQLQESNYSSSFQSRLGKAEWIRPYTDETIQELAGKGYKRLAVMCPAFVADCLETLEEIGLEGRQQWLELGGEDFRLITSLNAEEPWINCLADMIREKALSTAKTASV